MEAQLTKFASLSQSHPGRGGPWTRLRRGVSKYPSSQSHPGRGGPWTCGISIGRLKGSCLNPIPAEGVRGLARSSDYSCTRQVSIPSRPRGSVDDLVYIWKEATASQSHPGRGGPWTPSGSKPKRRGEGLNPIPAEGVRGRVAWVVGGFRNVSIPSRPRGSVDS